MNPGHGALDKFRELYRKGIGSDDDEVVLRELIRVINDDNLFADEFTELRAFTDPGPHGNDEVVYPKNIPGNTADEKIESLVKAIDDDEWIEGFAQMLIADFSMDEQTFEGEACNHTPEGKECPEHGLAECGSMMVTMGEDDEYGFQSWADEEEEGSESEYTGKLHPSIDITRDVDEPNFCYDCKLISNTIGEIDNDSDETDVVCPRCGSEGYVEASPEEIEQYSNVAVKEEDMREQRLARRVIELTQRLQSFKEQIDEMDPAAQDPEEIKKQQTITTNLNQMKAAGVDIDPSKGTEDPAFNKEVGSKVAAALADPALGQQLKGVLGKVKD